MQTLRPELYRRLQQHMGTVKLSKQGLAIKWSLRPGKDGKLERFFNDSIGDDWGEYYRVCCPFCKDKRFRLSINHMWGYEDPVTGSKNLWLIGCHHRNCFSDPDLRYQFYRDIWFSTTKPIADKLFEGKKESKANGQMIWPGTVWPIDRLPPDHPARVYLTQRKFDVKWLHDQFRVGYLLDPIPECRYLQDRIIIPIFMEKKLVGYQARCLDKPPSKDIPKYYTSKNLPRGNLLYNFDIAVEYPFVVVVEGPTDVWRFGPEAVAALGTWTSFQAHLLEANWKKIVILLDEDAVAASRDLLNRLKVSMNTSVVEVRLPKGMDPGDFETSELLRNYVFSDLRRQNFELELVA